MNWINALFAAPLVSKALMAVVILAAGFLGTRILLTLLRKSLEKSKMEKAAFTLILSLAKVVLYLLIGLSAASALGIDVTGIVAMASVLTLALSLALQNMVSNVIGGFTILYTHPFHSGDYVEIAGQGGTVREINMTYTMLTTPDNKQIAIPNSAVVAAQIVNYSAMDTRRVEITISASYDTPVRQVLDALLEAGSVEKVLREPEPFAGISSYGESAINYVLRMWVKNQDYWDVYFLVAQRVRERFEEQGVTMPYPHVNVHLDKQP